MRSSWNVGEEPRGERHGVGARTGWGRLAQRRRREAAEPRVPAAVRYEPRGWGLYLGGATILSRFYAGHRDPERRALRPAYARRGAGVGDSPDSGPPHQPRRRW